MILIVGAGIAGLSCAIAALAAGADVELVTPGRLYPEADGLAGGNTALAQGGVAAAVGVGDQPSAHLADTLAAGAGIVDAEAATLLTDSGAQIVGALIAAGLPVDRAADGSLSLGLEGAHGRARIVHSGGDRSGAALHTFLSARVRAAATAGRLTVTEQATAQSLVTASGAVTGAVLGFTDGTSETRVADAVVLATGGYAGLFPGTSNHAGARGSGIVLAARAGALLADLEFVQFHPTVLHPDAGSVAGAGELISEAVRGAGAVLRDGSGARFMVDRHPLAELAPRDVVSREIHRVLRERGDTTVWLDATEIERTDGPGALGRRFPGITRAITAHGLDWARHPIPVSPAAHYTMGGVASDLDGRSSVPGLFVAGEVAATGVHGANRLASNSLLEGLVFGAAAGRAAAAFGGATPRDAAGLGSGEGRGILDALGEAPLAGASRAGASRTKAWLAEVTSGGARGQWRLRGRGLLELAGDAVTLDTVDDRSAPRASADTVREAIAAGLGIERDAGGLRATAAVCARSGSDEAALGSLLSAAALGRCESRGAHQRADFPELDPALARRRGIRLRRRGAAVAEDTGDTRRTASTPGEPSTPGGPSTPSKPGAPGTARTADAPRTEGRTATTTHLTAGNRAAGLPGPGHAAPQPDRSAGSLSSC